MAKPDAKYIRDVYDRIHYSGVREDAWHRQSTRAIRHILNRWVPPRFERGMNLGSGGINYGLDGAWVDVDMSIGAVVSSELPTVSDGHSLAFRSGVFDLALCVGSVINYVSLLEVMSEAHRVIRKHGIFIVEYERITSSIALRSPSSDISPQQVTYRGEPHTCWYYSDSYVEAVIDSVGFRLLDRRYFHIGSELLIQTGLPTAIASVGMSLDPLVKCAASRFAANAALCCEKYS